MKNAFVASVLLASAASAIAKDLYTSPDGSCGPNTVFTCKQSFYGGCCGPDHKCGSTADVCGTGCQSEFGYCSPAANATTKDKRWNLGMPKFVLPVKPITSSSSSYKASASIYPSKSLNGTNAFSHGKPTPAAAHDYASTVTVTSVAAPTRAPASPWWWPFGGNGIKSAISAAAAPTPAKGGSQSGSQGDSNGGSQADRVVYSKFTTLTITYTKTHTYSYKGSKSLSYETYAAPTVCPVEKYTTLSTVTKTKTHTVTTQGSTSLSYEPYVTKSLCTLERPVTTSTAISSLSSSVKPSNPWWGPASVTKSSSSVSGSSSSASQSSSRSGSASLSSTSVGPTFRSSSVASPSSTPVGPTFGSSSVASPSSTPVGPTFGSSSTASPSSSFSRPVPSGSISVPVKPVSSSESSSGVSSSFSHSDSSASISSSIPSGSISIPVGPSLTSSGIVSSSTGSQSISSSIAREVLSNPSGPSFTGSEIMSSLSLPVESSFTSSSSEILSLSSGSLPVGPTATSSSFSEVSSSSSSSESLSAGPSATLSSVSEASSSSATSSAEISSSIDLDRVLSSSSSSSVEITSSSTSEASTSSESVSASSSVEPSFTSRSSAEISSSTLSEVSSSLTFSAEFSSSSSITSSSSVESTSASESATITSSSVESSITSSASSSDFASVVRDISSSVSITSSSSAESSSSSASESATITSSSSESSITSSASSSSSDSSTFSTITSSSSSSASSSSSTISSSSSTTQSSCLTAPTLTAATLPNCTPCEGQGTGPFCGYDINSNSYEVTPITCNVVYYNFDITGASFGPDGVERPVMWVNGQMPGPPIKASWGDTVVVTVNNKLTNNNGTSIHFHGIRQLNNNMNDGVPSITQCPIAPGSSMTYTWVAENYGTSWYHSHFAIQAWEGVMGPMIIDGPHSADFDVDMGPFQLQDWSHFTVDSRYDLAQNATPIPGAPAAASGAPATYGGPVLLDTGLINGMNIWNGDDQSGEVSGSRFVAPQTFTPGKKYLFRFINSAIQSTYKVYLDNHQFTVIASDFVPITPYTTNILNINIGQRYDVIIEATNTTGSFFLRADNQNACAGTVQALDIRAIINYDGSAVTDGSSGNAYSYTGECVDEPMSSLVPVAPMSVGSPDITEGALDVVVQGNSAQLYKWYISGTTFMAEYNDPTLLAVWENETLPTDSGALLIELPQAKQWIYVIVESVIPLPHPLHLHGHDFFILAEGTGSYSSDVVLQLANPPRRDTALMPAAGFIVLAFETDNPGVWLMHCHIGWHTSMGFALQFVEMQDQIQSSGALKNSCALNSTCNAWDDFSTAGGLVQLDSGV